MYWRIYIWYIANQILHFKQRRVNFDKDDTKNWVHLFKLKCSEKITVMYNLINSKIVFRKLSKNTEYFKGPFNDHCQTYIAENL